jgi:hypothetical protein
LGRCMAIKDLFHAMKSLTLCRMMTSAMAVSLC